jgi:3-deoxy-D-manno-octulosonate 8-phosphate phosphatase (KDO 8-P phosphatase)
VELHLGVKDKLGKLSEILERTNLQWSQIAYIGDDVNDLDVLERAGISACPADAMEQVTSIANYICQQKGGYGAFREFAEWLIKWRS